MIVIYGHRTYGAVDAQGGQYAVTRFAHVYYMPLIPTGSVWMTGPAKGLTTPLNAKSVLAAYARTWGLLLSVVFFFMGIGGSGILTALFGLLLAAASIATWKWSKRSSEDAKLRGNLNALAFGTYCSPHLLPAQVREHYKLELNRRQQVTQNARPPEDVAKLGTRDLGELVRSYGILSLHDNPQARAQLTELLQLKAPSTDLQQGIYRDKHLEENGEGFQLPAERAAMIATIEDAASHRMLRA